MLVAGAAACALLKGPRSEHRSPDATVGFRDEAGEQLVAELDCLACHAANEPTRARLRPLCAPDLTHVGARRSPAWLRSYLADPHAGKDAPRMPDLLRPFGAERRRQVAEALTQYLASLGGPFEPAPEPPGPWPIEHGGELFTRLGCLACHQDGLANSALAAKTDRRALARFLADPLAAWPSGRMPDMDLDPKEADALAAWLLRKRHAAGPTRIIEAPGLRSDVYHFEHELTVVPELEGLFPARTLVVPTVGHEEDDVTERYAVRLSGQLLVPSTGEHTLYTSSDDGSLLFIDGELVVDNDGLHANSRADGEIELDAGWHELTLTFFENSGGAALAAGWVGPDDEQIPFTPEQLRTTLQLYEPEGWEAFEPSAQLVAEGRRQFERLNCGACHTGEGLPPARADAPPFDELFYLQDGCLGDVVPGGVPDYRLTEGQKSSLRNVLVAAAALAEPLPDEVVVERTLARLDCLACHARGDAGGPEGSVRAAFASSADLGDEGRLPPDLTGVGAKLRRETLQEVLVGDGRVRPYMHARMPRFGAAAVEHLGDALFAADGGRDHIAEPAFDPERIAAGRRLTGSGGGLSCISCHTTAGQDSIGLPGLDLARMHARLQRPWFERWMREPLAMRAGTRMPSFFDEGRSSITKEFDGDAEAQIDAVWAYLALGDAMPLPPGVVIDHAAYEIVAAERPAYVGSFMQGLSARVLSVGFPERLSVAFDQHHVRLARTWTGDFFQAAGTWRGRAGQLETPGGETARDLPDGPAFAVLPAHDAPWPTEAGKLAGWRLRGHTRDEAGLPTFRYALDGRSLVVEESPRAELGRDGPYLVRRFVLSLGPGARRPVHRAAVADEITAVDGGWETSDGLRISVRNAAGRVRDRRAHRELIVLPRSDAFEIELRW